MNYILCEQVGKQSVLTNINVLQDFCKGIRELQELSKEENI